MNGMDRSIKRVAIAALVMFLILLIDVNYLQAAEPNCLASSADNNRTAAAESAVQRGSIVTADGVTVAKSVSTGTNSFQREYTNGLVYAPVTGYKSVFATAAQAPNFASGVEMSENSLLNGSGSQLVIRNFIDTITNKPQKGATVTLTVNSKAQQTAYQELAATLNGKTFNGHQAVGGVVALNPSTGAILAMASYPSYDPNTLAVPDSTTFVNRDNSLISQNPSPLLNNAAQTTLPPGSTFKIVTTSSWYGQDSGRNPQTLIDSPEPLTLPNGNALTNDNGEICGNGGPQTVLITAFAQSCNTPFAKIGIGLGGQALKTTANAYGFNTPLSIPGVKTAESNFTADTDSSLTAFDAIGQHNTTATPLQEAMLASTIADNGTLMQPFLVQSAQASDLSTVSTTQPKQLGQPVSTTIAGYEKQMMTAVVQQGGTAAAFNAANEGGLVIAGKTGTAQNGVSPQSDAVFTAFAPASNPKIAVGVMIQGGGFGATSAAPIAVAVIKAYLATLGIQ